MTNSKETELKPWEVIEHGNLDWWVVDPSGDAELGNWLICKVRWKEHARLIASLPQLLKDKEELEDAIYEISMRHAIDSGTHPGSITSRAIREFDPLFCRIAESRLQEDKTGPMTMVQVPKTPETKNWPGAIEWPDDDTSEQDQQS